MPAVRFRDILRDMVLTHSSDNVVSSKMRPRQQRVSVNFETSFLSSFVLLTCLHSRLNRETRTVIYLTPAQCSKTESDKASNIVISLVKVEQIYRRRGYQ